MFQKNRFMKLLVILSIQWHFSSLFAQITITHPLDILGGLQDGSIQGIVEPHFTNDSLAQVFDGNPLTEAGVQNSNVLKITLAFNEPVSFSVSKVYFWNTGEWSLEVADSESDLDFASGSYQLLVDHRPYPFFAWDSVNFNDTQAKLVRITAENSQTDAIYIGEWTLESTLTLTSLYIYPHPPKVLPNTTLQLKIKALDENNRLHPYPLSEPIIWSTANSSIATVGEFGELTGIALGTTTITARSASGSISGSAEVSVLSDFQSPDASTKKVKVALVIQDPIIDSTNNRRIHEVRGWANPYILVDQLLDEFYQTSNGVIQFQVVETHDDGVIFTRLDSSLMMVDTLAYFFSSGVHLNELKHMAEQEGRVHFDYNYMIDYYDFDTKRNTGVIDEIWVYAYPFAGMYESQLVGPGAFWWNSPPLSHPGLQKLLSVMGWNYERGVAEALHSFGHRVESALWHAYGRWEGTNPQPNSWELFTRIDKDVPHGAHVGNIHFPPNGQSDYDYGNSRSVITYADNWKRYPYLLNEKRTVSCEEWGCNHLDYMRWWLRHLPRFQGVFEGVLNNWWHYVVDYQEAVELAQELSVTGIDDSHNSREPQGYLLEQNYPNPFNPATSIRFRLAKPGYVELKIYDTLGREVRTLINARMTVGEHRVRFEGRELSSGVYFYRLKSGDFMETKKMILLR